MGFRYINIQKGNKQSGSDVPKQYMATRSPPIATYQR